MNLYGVKTYYGPDNLPAGLDGLYETLETARFAIENNVGDLSENGTNHTVCIIHMTLGLYPEGEVIAQYKWLPITERYVEIPIEN